MRNVSLFAVSLVLLTSQVNIPALGNVTASALSQEKTKEYEVKLNTNSAQAIEIIGAPKPDFDAEVLAPLRAAQAAAAAKKKKATTTVRRSTRGTCAPVVGTPTEWMRAAGIAESDFAYVDHIISRESGWCPNKWNYAGSGAYGLGQALPATKMAKFGADYMTNPVTQLRWANAYAVGRYGSWANAYNFWVARHVW
jgi:hypothetical protein